MSRTTGNRFTCCSRRKSSHKKSLTPSSRARAASTSDCSNEASSCSQSGCWKSWARKSRKCSRAASGFGERGSRCVKCLISTMAARSSLWRPGSVIFSPIDVGDIEGVERAIAARVDDHPRDVDAGESQARWPARRESPSCLRSESAARVERGELSLSISISTGYRVVAVSERGRHRRRDALGQSPLHFPDSAAARLADQVGQLARIVLPQRWQSTNRRCCRRLDGEHIDEFGRRTHRQLQRSREPSSAGRERCAGHVLLGERVAVDDVAAVREEQSANDRQLARVIEADHRHLPAAVVAPGGGHVDGRFLCQPCQKLEMPSPSVRIECFVVRGLHVQRGGGGRQLGRFRNACARLLSVEIAAINGPHRGAVPVVVVQKLIRVGKVEPPGEET